MGSEGPQERGARILAATLALATAGGYDGVQMRAIAARANVAVGTLYRHFPSKAHLLIAALANEFERTNAPPDSSITGQTPAQRLHQVINHLNRAAQRNPLLTEAMIRAFVFADASAVTEIDRVERLADEVFARAMSDGAPTDEHYDIARVISHVWMANLLAWLTGRASVADVNKRLDLTVRLLIDTTDDRRHRDRVVRGA